MKALSLRQPWCDAILRGGKRIENRLAWTNSRFRGQVLLHASKGITIREEVEINDWAEKTPGVTWRPPPRSGMHFGGIVGIACVIGVVTVPEGPSFGGPELPVLIDFGTVGPVAPVRRALTEDERRWYMGGFALVLDEVRPLPFMPCRGMLGFFNVDPDVEADVVRAVLS